MHVATGKIADGKVVVEGVALPEGAVVTVFAEDAESVVRLPPSLQVELEEALADADREEGIAVEACSRACGSTAELGPRRSIRIAPGAAKRFALHHSAALSI